MDALPASLPLQNSEKNGVPKWTTSIYFLLLLHFSLSSLQSKWCLLIKKKKTKQMVEKLKEFSILSSFVLSNSEPK
jgi:hypothetical protein